MNDENPTTTPSATNDMLRYFRCDHLAEDLQDVSARFAELAHWIHHSLPEGAETTVAMRKLLESKDAAVRAALSMKES